MYVLRPMEFFDPPWEELMQKPFSLSVAQRSIESDRQNTLHRLDGVRTGDILPMIASPRHRIAAIVQRQIAHDELQEELRILGIASAVQHKIALMHGPRARLLDLRLDAWTKYKRIAKELELLADDDKFDLLEREKCRLIRHGIAGPYVRHLKEVDMKSAHALADRALQEGAPERPIPPEQLSADFVTAMLYNNLNADAEVMDMLAGQDSAPPIRPRPAS